jgi:hypothetical protein
MRFTLRDWMWLCVVVGISIAVEGRSYRKINDVNDAYESMRHCYSNAMQRIFDLEVDLEVDNEKTSIEIMQLQSVVGFLIQEKEDEPEAN